GVDDLQRGEGDVDQEDLGAVEEAGDVVGEPEHGRAARCRVGADALEHAAAVVQRVRQDVDLGVVPVDELAVHPDLLDLVQGHWFSSDSLGDAIADLRCATGELACVGAGLGDAGGGGGLAQEVEHHGHRAHGGHRVGRAGAGDVGGRPVHGLEERRPGAIGVEVGRGGAADAAGDGRPQVGEDVAEQVVGDDHV